MKKFIITILIICLGFGGGFYLFTYNPTVNDFISNKVGPAIVSGWEWFIDLFKKAELPQEPVDPEKPIEPEQPEVPSDYYGIETTKIYDTFTDSVFDIKNDYKDKVVLIFETSKIKNIDNFYVNSFSTPVDSAVTDFDYYLSDFFTGDIHTLSKNKTISKSCFSKVEILKDYEYVLFTFRCVTETKLDIFAIGSSSINNDESKAFENLPLKMIIGSDIQNIVFSENFLTNDFVINNKVMPEEPEQPEEIVYPEITALNNFNSFENNYGLFELKNYNSIFTFYSKNVLNGNYKIKIEYSALNVYKRVYIQMFGDSIALGGNYDFIEKNYNVNFNNVSFVSFQIPTGFPESKTGLKSLQITIYDVNDVEQEIINYMSYNGVSSNILINETFFNGFLKHEI